MFETILKRSFERHCSASNLKDRSPESASIFSIKSSNLDEMTNSTNIRNEIEDCKNYIINQKELLKMIHQQQKKLKTLKRNNSLNCLNTKPILLSVNCQDSKIKKSQSEIQKAKFKKESLESEIEYLENHMRIKKGSCCPCPELYNQGHIDSGLNMSFERKSNEFDSFKKIPHGFSQEELLKLANERDFYRQKLHFEITQRDAENKELENQLNQTRDELVIEQKKSRDKVTRLEEELKISKEKFETMTLEKDEFANKVKCLENKLSALQYEITKKDKDGFNKELSENTEKHLTNLCQTLTSQLEDMRFQLKAAEEKLKRSETEQNLKQEQINCYIVQIDTLKKELEQNSESYLKIKRTYEEQLNNHIIREKENKEVNERMIRERDEEILDLKSQLNDAKNFKFNNQQLHDALITDFKRTISKQDEEIRALQESLKLKQVQFDSYQRELELSIGPKFEERIKKEKQQWEQEQNFIIKRELTKVNEEKTKDINKLQDELTCERDKHIFERDKALKLEKQIEELNQELKFCNKEKSLAISKAKESLKAETDKLKAEILNDKQEEINRFKKIINELEDEIHRLKIEQHQNIDKDREFIMNVEKLEKSLIKDINEEQRKLSSLIPGLMPKIVNYSNIRNNYSVKNIDNAMTLNTFQLAFNNLKCLLDEVTQNYQNIKMENEQNKRINSRLIQEKDDELEIIKRQFEKQKQKEFESLREYINKDQDISNSYTAEISSLVNALKNKDKEIKEIQENMSEWKKETLSKLADKFEVELSRELDKRMKEYKDESSNQQFQLEKLKKEIDCLIKECRQSSANHISQEQHERMIRYLQTRLNDLRDENLILRDRFKATNFVQPSLMTANYGSNYNENDYNRSNVLFNAATNQAKNPFMQEDDNLVSSMYSSSIDGDDNLESRNEILQQKLQELQKLQIQLNNVQS